MQRIKNSLFLLLLIPALCPAQQQDMSDINNVASQIIKNLHQRNIEKIYIQTNKLSYLVGEKIWFKAWVTNAIDGMLNQNSKILYVDLVNDHDSVIHTLLLNAGDLKTDGTFLLPDSMRTGLYWLRAYTKQLLGQDINNIGLAPVYVIRAASDSIPADEVNFPGNLYSTTTSGKKMVFDIYPEGGTLISGTDCVVAVKVHDENNAPLAVSGIVRDARDTIVARFATNRFGLGKFSFSPSWFGRYSICVLNNDRYDSVEMLPKVNPFSAQLAITSQTEQTVTARVMLEDSIYTKDYITYILGISKDSLCFASVGRGMYELNIPLAAFPSGVARLMLFNAAKQLVSERDIYVPKNDIVTNVTTDKEKYGPREAVRLTINVANAFANPLQSVLCVAVNDSRMVVPWSNNFTDSLAKYSTSDADLFMLTSKSPVITSLEADTSKYNDENVSLTINGHAFNRKSEPASNEIITLMSNKENLLVLQDTTDDKGQFHFQMPDFADGSEFTLQSNARDLKDEIKFSVDSFPVPTFSTPMMVKNRFRTELERSRNSVLSTQDSLLTAKSTLRPVKVEASAIKKANNAPSNVITVDMLKEGGINSAGDAVLRSGKFHLFGGFLIAGGPNGFNPTPKDEPRVFMDGIEMTVPNNGDPSEKSPVLAFLKTIPTNDIDYIRILTGVEGTIYGVRGGHGVIEIHSTNRLRNNSSTNALTRIFPKGFHQPPAFEMPDYNDPQVKRSKAQDARTSIYWNGDIITGIDGKITVTFFTADFPGKYVVTVTGLTTSGDKIYKTITVARE